MIILRFIRKLFKKEQIEINIFNPNPTAFQFLKNLNCLPVRPEILSPKPSNSEIRRLCEQKAVRINGVTPNWKDTIEFPITDLVFFPNNDKARVTLL